MESKDDELCPFCGEPLSVHLAEADIEDELPIAVGQ